LIGFSGLKDKPFGNRQRADNKDESLRISAMTKRIQSGKVFGMVIENTPRSIVKKDWFSSL